MDGLCTVGLHTVGVCVQIVYIIEWCTAGVNTNTTGLDIVSLLS